MTEYPGSDVGGEGRSFVDGIPGTRESLDPMRWELEGC